MSGRADVTMQRMTGCPGCEVAVPVGRWCNRCGARLDVADVGVAPAISAPPRRLLTTIGLSFVLALAVVRFAPVPGPHGGGAVGDVELPFAAELDAPPFVASRTVVMATVVCSSIDLRHVPVAQLGSAEVGELVRLPVGDCVVHARPQGGRAGIGTASLAQ